MPNREYRTLRSAETNSPIQTVPQFVPVGPPPQAIRIIREGSPSVVLPLEAGRLYQLGRGDRADIVFDDLTISRQHGTLYFSERASAWVHKNAGFPGGTVVRSDEEKPIQLLPGQLIGLLAGDVLLLGTNNRVEFLAQVPEEALGIKPSGSWKSSAGKKLERNILRAAHHSEPVVLLGESGSGKTIAAKEIHRLDGTRKGPFAAINCSALYKDEVLLHSFFLGHVKGAYTGAAGDHLGILFYADNGTLFLDEVESMPAEAQRFLLTVLEGTEPLRPLGAPASKARPRPTFRLVSASKEPLETSRKLRHDLVERLSGEAMKVPTLEERREDIPIFTRIFLDELEASHNDNFKFRLSQESLQALVKRKWPGQIRELKNTVRAVAERKRAEAVIAKLDTRSFVLSAEDFDDYVADRRDVVGQQGGSTPPEKQPRIPSSVDQPQGFAKLRKAADVTADEVDAALRLAEGKVTVAAGLLGMSYNTFRTVLDRLRK